tara:strand:+ start:33 stop:797 length:765 start_codon:yes stop_codon:yes gene_type:complete
MAQSGIFNILPTDYQLYLESMLPYMNEVPIGKEYFDEEMEDQIIDSVLTDYWEDNTGSIGERDYITDKYREGTNDPNTGTGFNKLFNTLGSYNYKINPPAAGADPSVTITDRYDWNPAYGERNSGKLGWVEEGGRDVTTSMLAKHLLWNQRPTSLGGSGFDFANTAEMVGNYFGHRQSEGQGRDVNITIPINNETFRSYGNENFGNLNESMGPISSWEISNMFENTSPINQPISNQPPKGAAGFNSGGIASFVI